MNAHVKYVAVTTRPKKPNSQKKLPKNLAKWSAAADYCKKRNWEFIVLTEKGLKLLKNKSQNIL